LGLCLWGVVGGFFVWCVGRGVSFFFFFFFFLLSSIFVRLCSCLDFVMFCA